MPKVSIIIPVYNTEKYLKKCLGSIINQEYQDYEVIIINDGSTDNSQEVIKKYVEKYKNKIFLFNKINEGISEARNLGLKMAKGEYITFVDSDDYIDKSMLLKMIKKATEKDFDMVICDLVFLYSNSTGISKSNVHKDLLTPNEIKEEMINIHPAMCGKLIKKELYNNIIFKKGIWFEDVESYFRMYPKLNKIGFINEPLYFYLQRDSSITYTYNEKLYDLVNIWPDILKEYEKNNLYNTYKDELEYSTIRYCFATFIKRLVKTKNIKEFNKGYRYSRNTVKKLFPYYKKNKYLKKYTCMNVYLKYFNYIFAYGIFFYNLTSDNLKKINNIVKKRG